MSKARLPVIRLKPKAASQAIRHGYPWVYDNEIVADRRTRKLALGSIAVLEDDARQPLGLVAANPMSRIFARVIDRDIDAEIDRKWFKARIETALALRERLFEAPYYRMVHAEADGLPGLVIDRFGDVLAVQPNAAWAEIRMDDIVSACVDLTGAKAVYKNAKGRARALEGLDADSDVLVGKIDGPVDVPMNGATYLADLTGGQKTGLFYDQRSNHAFVQTLAKNASVLDVFSHVGGFGLAALAGGAASVVLVDSSKPALELAREGARRMGREDGFDARHGDAFDVLDALGNEGDAFGLVICDPPAFAPNRKALDAGLRAYERVARLASRLVEPGGFLTLCSCSHAADLARFRAACVRGIGRAGRSGQLLRIGYAGPDHPQHPQLAESGYLKALTFRLA